VVALAGCADGAGKKVVHVRGTVTHKGKPLPLGLIVFEPDPAKGNTGPQGHAEIKDGKFDTRISQKGAVPGPQLVRITGGDGVNPEPFTPFGNLLFDEYSTRIDGAPDGPDLTFDVPAPKRPPPSASR
jgi:hypothetical protein